MDQIDFHYVKLHNAIRAHQAVHSELQKNAHLDGPTRRRFCIRRRLYEQEIIKLLKQKQQQQLNERPQHKPGDTTETAAFSLPQSQSKRDSMGVLVPKAATTSKGSLFFSLPKQRGGSAAHLSCPSSSSSSCSASSSSYPKAGGNGGVGGGVLVPKKIGGGLGTTTQFFIRRHRQTTPKKNKKGSSLATTSALSDDPALKRELAAIPHINTFDRGMFIEELLEGQERKKALKAELEQNKNTAGGAGESLEEEQDPSSSRGSNGSAALAPLSSSSSSAASSPTREAPLVVFTGILEADSATETPVSSACPSPVKVEKAKSITFEYNAAKDAFIRALDLVPREEYEELANKKNSRKRRTTANPQFSSAALEAKRQTKMEIIAERKNRRQQERAMKAQGGGKGGGGTGKDFSKLLPQGSMKVADQEESQDGLLPTRGNSLAPSSSSSSSNSNLAPIIIISKPGGKKPLFSDNKSKSNFKIENRQVFPGLYLVKRITRGNYTCKLCGELVQCTLDTVLVCKRCSVFFHLNCATPFAKVGGQVGCDELACPGCGASSEDDDEQQQQQKQKQKQKQQLPNIKEIKEEKGEGDEEEMTPRDLLGRLHDLHQYIHSLNHANQVLGSLCLQRENEANQLRREVAQYEGVWETMNKVLGEKLFSTCQ